MMTTLALVSLAGGVSGTSSLVPSMKPTSLPAIYHLRFEAVSQEWGSEGGSGSHTQQMTPIIHIISSSWQRERGWGGRNQFLWENQAEGLVSRSYPVVPLGIWVQDDPFPSPCFPKLASVSSVYNWIGEGPCPLRGMGHRFQASGYKPKGRL